MSNLYEILEVPETATLDDIKKSYRRLSMIYHPDKNKNNPDATAKFQKLAEAYETLGDVDKKKEYDMMRHNPFMKMMNHNNNNNNHPMEDLLANLFGGGGMPFAHMASFQDGDGVGVGGGGSGTPFVQVFHNGIPINHSNFVRGMQKPTPIIQHILVPLDKILTGTTIPVDIERWIIQDGVKVFEKEIMYVTVPKGIDEGEMIVLRERGNIISDTNKGDIKLFVRIENDTEFKRSGLELIYEKTISVKEALCGFTFELKYVTGKVYTINNNSGHIICNGYKKIIPNMGLSRDNHVGNLIIIFNVKFPDKLTDESIAKLKQIDF